MNRKILLCLLLPAISAGMIAQVNKIRVHQKRKKTTIKQNEIKQNYFNLHVFTMVSYIDSSAKFCNI
jgi:hypothetical protein